LEEEPKIQESHPEKEMEMFLCSRRVESFRIQEAKMMARRYPSCVTSASERSGISKSKLYQSYRRGIGAHRTNRASVRNLQGRKYAGGTKMSPQQWACARVNKLARLKSRAGYDRDLLR